MARQVYVHGGVAVLKCRHGVEAPELGGHKSVTFVFPAGAFHLTDEAHAHVLGPCEQGCTEYVLVGGDDPWLAEAEDYIEPERLG